MCHIPQGAGSYATRGPAWNKGLNDELSRLRSMAFKLQQQSAPRLSFLIERIFLHFE
jgi:hypothetical protein